MALRILVLVLATFSLISGGCGQKDERVNVGYDVGTENLILVRPIGQLFSAVLGEGVEVENVRKGYNSEGLLKVQIEGYNRAYKTKRFLYKFQWVDKDGMVISTRTSTWVKGSAVGKSNFSISATAPNADAVDFRFDARKGN